MNPMSPSQEILTIHPADIRPSEMHAYLLGAVAPRPIAFASTVDKDGQVNLSPFSFFNTFGSNPPILVFSPARRGRDNTTKHTLENVKEVPEVVVNIVNYPMVEQMSLASTEYPRGVNEFIKAGLTPVASDKVSPPRVLESPVSFECKVKEVIALGDGPGAGNLVVCEVLVMHVKKNILNEAGKIDPFKIDAVARMGGDWYCRANGEALFEIAKPLTTLGIGVDQIPANIRNSVVLTGNDLGKLGNVEHLPNAEAVGEASNWEDVKEVMLRFKNDSESLENHLHTLAKEYLTRGEVDAAWKILLQIV
jgi:flavin reductase (DIM6/NTAB) family NADH-FMN oxidoreductase RutF